MGWSVLTLLSTLSGLVVLTALLWQHSREIAIFTQRELDESVPMVVFRIGLWATVTYLRILRYSSNALLCSRVSALCATRPASRLSLSEFERTGPPLPAPHNLKQLLTRAQRLRKLAGAVCLVGWAGFVLGVLSTLSAFQSMHRYSSALVAVGLVWYSIEAELDTVFQQLGAPLRQLLAQQRHERREASGSKPFFTMNGAEVESSLAECEQDWADEWVCTALVNRASSDALLTVRKTVAAIAVLLGVPLALHMLLPADQLPFISSCVAGAELPIAIIMLFQLFALAFVCEWPVDMPVV